MRDKLAQLRHLEDVIIKAEDRGRDSFGLACMYIDKSSTLERYIGRPSEHRMALSDWYDIDKMSMVINNNRAEPTTEFVADKEVEDIQPFQFGDWIVAHNGTIANDKELIRDFSLEVLTDIDSAVIPCLLNQVFGERFDPAVVAAFLQKYLVGSFALAIAHTKHPTELLLMTNYKPLYLSKHYRDDTFLFTSLENYLTDSDIRTAFWGSWSTMQIPPYTALWIQDGTIDTMSLLREENKKALVVCSGGLDSTVVAAKALKEGYDVTLLHFRYKCRAESREVQAVRDIASRLGVELEFVDTDIFKEVIRGSRLTGTFDENVASGVAGAEFAHEWVPARNLIMLSIATGIAEARGIGTIMLGNNLEESGAYPDNEMEFINKLNQVMPFAVQVNKKVRIEMPVGNLMKHEIVKLGLEIGAPLDLCWSCYEPGELHCGDCGPCYMRKTAFAINGAEEVIKYASDVEV